MGKNPREMLSLRLFIHKGQKSGGFLCLENESDAVFFTFSFTDLRSLVE